MKKLLAVLIACMTITCAFASCVFGGGSSSKSSSSQSDVDEEIEPLLGQWDFEEEGISFIFNEDGTADLWGHSPEEIGIKDGDIAIFNQKLHSDEYEYDGKTLTIYYDDEIFVKLTRTDGKDKDSFVGKYKIKGGELADWFSGATGSDGDDMYIEFTEDDMTYITIEKLIKYTVKNGKLKLSGAEALGFPDEKFEYEVDDDTLTLTDKDGDEIVFERND